MLIFKFIGGTSVVISSLLIYLEMQKYEKLKLAQLNAYISLIEYIKNQVECFLLPIDSIIQSVSEKIIKECGIKEGTDLKSFATVNDIVQSTVFYIEGDSIGLIRQFAHDFGMGYRDEQIRLCEHYIKELIKEREKLKENSAKEKKVRLALSLCISVSLILLLI